MEVRHPLFLSQEAMILPGRRRVLNVPSPAAAADWVATVDGGRQWRLVGGRAAFAADATVGNRNLGLQFLAAGQLIYRNFSVVNFAAGSAVSAVYEIGQTVGPNLGAGGIAPVQFSPVWLAEGDQITSATVFVGPGDQYSAIQLVLEEVYFDNAELKGLVEREDELIMRLLGGR